MRKEFIKGFYFELGSPKEQVLDSQGGQCKLMLRTFDLREGDILLFEIGKEISYWSTLRRRYHIGQH